MVLLFRITSIRNRPSEPSNFSQNRFLKSALNLVILFEIRSEAPFEIFLQITLTKVAIFSHKSKIIDGCIERGSNCIENIQKIWHFSSMKIKILKIILWIDSSVIKYLINDDINNNQITFIHWTAIRKYFVIPATKSNIKFILWIWRFFRTLRLRIRMSWAIFTVAGVV